MAKPRHTIEFNGQRYDAVTGQRLTPSGKTVAPALDGFVTRKASEPQPVTPAPKQRVSVISPKPAPKSAKRSKTLMRTAVKKPTVAAPKEESKLKKSPAVPAHRLHRAQQVSKSQLVSKFGNGQAPALTAQVAPVPVKAPPSHPPVMDLRQQIAAVTQSPPSAKHTFERALHQAESHKQPKIKRNTLSRRVSVRARQASRSAKLVAGAAIVLLLAGFFMYQNAPQLSMRLAATRAGVAASLPGYEPAGFTMSRQIEYAPGQITISYHSNSDDRAFELKQQKTELTDQELAEELDGDADKAYQTYQDEGKTIYIYDGSNATWVEEGMLYQIEGQSSLNSDQLIRLATSI